MKNNTLKDILIFSVLLVSVHFLYIAWGRSGYYPVNSLINDLFTHAGRMLFNQSAFVLEMFNVNFTVKGQTFYIPSTNGSTSWLEVSPGCTSLKQWIHWIVLMCCFPGPWKHKLWYIPLGIAIIQVVSVFRITGLAFTLIHWPSQFDFFHDYIFKTLFYGVIFLMWVFWVERLEQSGSVESERSQVK